MFSSIEECPEEYSGTLGNRFVDIKNQRYNYLEVLYLVGFKNQRAEWLCKCHNCGKYVIVNSHNLRTGHTQTCGCLISERLRCDLSGQIINQLQVIKYAYSKNEHGYWWVKCLSCGKQYTICADILLRKRQYSCGCVNESYGERTISAILDEFNVHYIKQYHFDDLRGQKQQFLRFDFGVMDCKGNLLYLIEYQGEQHYRNSFNLPEDEYQQYLRRDELKRQYCQQNKIPLIEIRYDEEIKPEKILMFKTKMIEDESFLQYKKPSMFIANTMCNFKCDKENGTRLCINQGLSLEQTKVITIDALIRRYQNNSITSSIVFGGLENFDEFEQLFNFIKCFRQYSQDDVVIYTGFYPDEVTDKIAQLRQFSNIIIKYGRFVPNQEPHYDEVLGIKLASDNQYAERIAYDED